MQDAKALPALTGSRARLSAHPDQRPQAPDPPGSPRRRQRALAPGVVGSTQCPQRGRASAHWSAASALLPSLLRAPRLPCCAATDAREIAGAHSHAGSVTTPAAPAARSPQTLGLPAPLPQRPRAADGPPAFLALFQPRRRAPAASALGILHRSAPAATSTDHHRATAAGGAAGARRGWPPAARRGRLAGMSSVQLCIPRPA